MGKEIFTRNQRFMIAGFVLGFWIGLACTAHAEDREPLDGCYRRNGDAACVTDASEVVCYNDPRRTAEHHGEVMAAYCFISQILDREAKVSNARLKAARREIRSLRRRCTR